MKTIYKSELRKKCLASAINGAKLGLAIGIPIGAAIGAPIFGVGAVANGAICGAIGLGIGAGIGALIPLIKYRRYKKIDDLDRPASPDRDADNREEPIDENTQQESRGLKLKISASKKPINEDNSQDSLDFSHKKTSEEKPKNRLESIKKSILKNHSSLFHHKETRQPENIDNESEDVSTSKASLS